MYERYLEVRRSGLDLEAATSEVARSVGPAVVIAAMTTVGTFYAFFVTDFSGLQEFGLLTGIGIMLMAIAAFILLPALVRTLRLQARALAAVAAGCSSRRRCGRSAAGGGR